MSTGRVLWIIFCCFMAACWAFFTFWTIIVPLVMVPLSLLAILIPVGKAPNRPHGGSMPGAYLTPPGWYEVSPGRLQWWDGYQWTPQWSTPHDVWQQSQQRWGPPDANVNPPPPQWPPPPLPPGRR